MCDLRGFKRSIPRECSGSGVEWWGRRDRAAAVYMGSAELSVVIHALPLTGFLLPTHASSSVSETYHIFPLEGFNVSFMLD